MNNKKNIKKRIDFGWIYFVSKRFSRVDRKGRSAVTSFLASLGIFFGVMTLIVTLSVMNGFQMGFIEAIMEISSYHLRVSDLESENSFLNFCKEDASIASVVPFYEAQSLMVGRRGRQCAAVVRAVPENVLDIDSGFEKQVSIYSGSFDLSSPNSIVLGSELSRKLGLQVGNTVNLLALSGGQDVDLMSDDRIFTVKGIFYSGYADINSSYSFISSEDGKKYFGKDAKCTYGIKLKDSSKDAFAEKKITLHFPDCKVESWRSYNRTFFGALRIEKVVLMMLVFLIFVVVSVNIYNGMRRMVFERKEEIAVMSALGGNQTAIQSVFIVQGARIGILGAVPGLIAGILCSINMDKIFVFIADAAYWVEYFFTSLFAPSYVEYLRENPMFLLYARIPARMMFPEILTVTLFGVFSSFIASWISSRNILKMAVSEVLRDE